MGLHTAKHSPLPLSRWMLILLWVFGAPFLSTALARERVSSTVSSTNVSVGEPIQYELNIEGDFDPDDAPVPNLPDFEVQGTSQGSQISIINGSFNRRYSIVHTLVPRKEGKFTIPPMDVRIGGKVYKTNEHRITVAPGQTTTGAGDMAFAEMRLQKKTAYVGEVVPLELRVYLDGNATWNANQMPMLTGNGFTLKPFGKPTQQPVEMAGTNYIQLTFRSAITAGKAGKLTIGPVPMKFVFSKRPSFGLRGRNFAQELDVSAPAVEFEAELLPSKGRPANFTGAVGKFMLEAEGTPNRVNAGEPVQMTLRISGEGNFDQIEVPALHEPEGWRVYDAEQQFRPNDAVGFSGMKMFTLPVAPLTQKTTMPVFAFNFFNPESRTYETLKSSAIPLTVVGGAPAAASSPAPTPSPAAPQAPPPKPADDILGIVPQIGAAWVPMTRFPPAAVAAAALAPLPLIVLLHAWRARRSNPQAQRTKRLRKERDELWSRLQAASTPTEILELGVRVLQCDGALVSQAEPQALDAPEIIAARAIDDDTRTAVEKLFEQRAALVYAGSEAHGSAAKAHDWVLDTVNAYGKSPAR